MLPLADLQRAFHAAVLGGGAAQELAVTGTLSLAEALSIHRGTAIGGLITALRLTYPTVDTLVGEAYFDQVGRDFVLARPPGRACLDDYGQTFAAFLETVPTGLPYLADTARLDWIIARTLRHSGVTRTFALDADVAIRLPASLSLLPLSYPAHLIRGALGDDVALSAIAMELGIHAVAVWRQGDTAAVRVLRPAAARFLQALMAGDAPGVALAQAGEAQDSLPIIQTDIFAAPFCTVLPTTETAL